MLALVLTATVLTAADLDGFERAWSKGDIAAASAFFSENASARFVMDPAETLLKRVDDQTFDGRDGIASLLWSFLPLTKLDAGERSVEKNVVRWPLTLSYAWLKKLGVDEGHFTAEAVLATDGRIRSLELKLSAEDAARAVPALPEQNKNVVRRYMEEVNKKNFNVVNEVLTPNFVQHSVVAVAPGRQGVADLYENLRGAFPDFHFTLDDVMAEGDRVAVRMTGRYTHKGEYLGVPPTGKAVQLLKMDIFRFVNGRCFEHWDSADRLGLLQQLGVIPKVPKWNNLPGYEGFR